MRYSHLLSNYAIAFLQPLIDIATSRHKLNAQRAVILFDLGDTLFEPLPREYGERNLLTFVRQVDVKDPDEAVIETFAEAKRAVAHHFAQRAFYTHREFITTAFKSCCESLGKDGSSSADAYATAQRDDVIEHLSPRTDCFSTLEDLNRRGHRLGIVSNIDDDWLTPLIDHWQLADHFDGILSSESARSCKPDQRIFRLACDQHGTSPSETIFVGDDEINDVKGGNRVGMTTVLYRKANVRVNDTTADHEIHTLSELLTLPSIR